MKNRGVSIVIALFAVFAMAAVTQASTPTGGTRHAHTGAKVSMKTARATALAKVPGGKIKRAELEREKGRLIYSFDIRVPGKSGIEEVQVDATDGSVVSVVHETAKKERQEAQQEKMEKKTPAAAH